MINANYGHITPELLEQVKSVLEDAANYKYSTSKVYSVHNQVFKLSEKPESCASCLRKRVSALRTWYVEYAKAQTDAEPLHLKDKEDNVVYAVFNSEDGVKGILNTPDGKVLKPGTYTTIEGVIYTVQPGGKATLKDNLL